MKSFLLLFFIVFTLFAFDDSKEKPIQERLYESGIASRYHSSLHGLKTANGERYDSTKLTAAHKKLRLGTRVKVVNQSNGKSVIVRINDRGPFVGERIIDLSHAAADSIGITIKKGLGKVDVFLID